VPVVLDVGGVEGPIWDELLRCLAVLSPNETELQRVTDLPTGNMDEIKAAAQLLLNKVSSNDAQNSSVHTKCQVHTGYCTHTRGCSLHLALLPLSHSSSLHFTSYSYERVLYCTVPHCTLRVHKCTLTSSCLHFVPGLQGVPHVLVKLGSDGSLLLSRDAPAGASLAEIRQEVVRAPEVVDTTGAGETFTAAFAVGLVEGMAYAEALKFACEYKT